MAKRFTISAILGAKDNISKSIKGASKNVEKATVKMRVALKKVGKLAKEVGQVFAKAFSVVAKGIGAAVVAAGGFLTAMTAVNASTAELNANAKAVGANAGDIEALATALKPMGFEVENVVDLFEELNNKLGESKGLGEVTTPVKEAFQILKLSYAEIDRLNPAKQFEAITNAALKLKDAQKGAAALDMLYSGEGAKIFGYFKAQGIKDIGAVMAKMKALNYQTDESREGAEKYTSAFGVFSTALGSIFKYAFGLLGKELTPILESLTTWLVSKKGLVISYVKEVVVWVRALVKDLKVWQQTGEALGKAVFFEKIANFFKTLSSNWETIKLVGKAVAVFAAALAVVGLFFIGLPALIALGITALAGLLTWLYSAREEIANWFIGVYDAIGNSIINGLKTAFNELLSVVPDFIKTRIGVTPFEMNQNLTQGEAGNAVETGLKGQVTPTKATVTPIRGQIDIKDGTGNATVKNTGNKGVNFNLQPTGGM